MEKWRVVCGLLKQSGKRSGFRNPVHKISESSADFAFRPRRDSCPLGGFLNSRERRFAHSWGIKSRRFGSTATLIQRNPQFAAISSEDISYFRKILGDRGVVQDKDTLNVANTDWMHKYKGSSFSDS